MTITTAPVHQFSYDETDRHYAADASDINWQGGDVHVTAELGRTTTFKVYAESKDEEGEVVAWSLRSEGGAYSMILWND